jgi:Rhodopirellula transposase DDE domain
VTVCHYPPGCSKWNPIERRLFSQISINWAGKPLRSLSVMLGYIRGTTTETGLTVEARLDDKTYRKGRKVAREEMDRLNIRFHSVCSDWNYTLSPSMS